jgi:hypothetical protein
MHLYLPTGLAVFKTRAHTHGRLGLSGVRRRQSCPRFCARITGMCAFETCGSQRVAPKSSALRSSTRGSLLTTWISLRCTITRISHAEEIVSKENLTLMPFDIHLYHFSELHSAMNNLQYLRMTVEISGLVW